ncbi:putative SOS response-associated peptidase YedK [Murinocardiopsis flavida]|uniref:Abasic site processing protein n=1 Tax=Murinocardiopsis flavida TaxID=645275 RepID=A0A2P8CXH7_9ACTN|nr:putative SOS response-associated peptidase YedK [Murinocardiopsis flavida]
MSARDDRRLISLFEVDERVGDELGPSWNVAPTQQVRVVHDEPRDGGSVRLLRNARWGLVPVWAKDPKVGARMINARSETVTEKPSFRSAAAKRRCVVPADGYYEWQQQGTGKKTPYYLHPEGDSPLAFAGLYELWPDPGVADDDPAKWLWSCTILTRPATDALGHIHDRTPVVVPDAMVGDWLDRGTTDKAQVRHLLDAIPDPHLLPLRVGTAVGSVRNNGPELIEPAA